MPKRSKKSFFPPEPGPEIYEDEKEAAKQLADPVNHQRYAREVLDLLPVKSGELLDVGSGLGWLVAEANKRGYRAIGYDPSRTLVRLGKKHLGLDLRQQFSTRQRFDVVVAKHVLEHVKPADKFLTQIRRVLKPTGVFLVACPNNRSLMHWLFGRRWYGLCPNQHVWQFTPASLTQLLEQNGFKIDKIIINSLDYRPGGLKQIVFWFLTTLANYLRTGDQVVVISFPTLSWP